MLLLREAARPSCRLFSSSLLSPRPILRRPQRQAFHPSSPRRDAGVDTLIVASNEIFSSIHSTGLPWAFAIPAAALAVRLLILAPVSITSLKVRARRANIQPLAAATAIMTTRQLQRTSAQVQRKDAGRLQSAIKTKYRYAIQNQRLRWKASAFSGFLPALIQLPVFLMMAESLRKMLGTSDGLLALLVKGVRNVHEWLINNMPGGEMMGGLQDDTDKSATVTSVDESPSANNAALLPDGISETPMSVDAATPLQSADITTSVDINQFLDPSLASEGMLWFHDLTVADPYHCLPFVISGITFYNILSSVHRVGPNWHNKPMLAVALIMGPVLWDAPAGLLLYWISSNLSASAANKALEQIWPTRKYPTACKRPLYMPPPVVRSRR